MLIVCPNCATSYMVDPTSVGDGGRMVRCARCKTTWFASATKNEPDVNAFVDDVIAEAEAQQTGGLPAQATSEASAGDDFGAMDTASVFPDNSSQFPPADDFPVPPAPFSEAEPEPLAVTDSPSLVPPIEHTGYAEPVVPHTPPDDDTEAETFAARRKRLQSQRKKSRRSSRWTAIVLVLFAFNVAVIGARHEVVRFLPQTASLFAAIGLPVNLRQLAFENVRITRDTQDGTTVLTIEGQITSTARKPVEVPRLRFAARNAAGQEIYAWTAKPERSILGPGESLPFTSRLATPPADANDVMMRFFTANDAMAGTK